MASELIDVLRQVLQSGLLNGSTTLHDRTRAAVYAALAKAEGR